MRTEVNYCKDRILNNFIKSFIMNMYNLIGGSNMSDNNVQITSKGIRNSLKRYTALKSICEYIWNGFDAKATQVNIEIIYNELDSISSIIISDNGYGIDRDSLDEKFTPFFQSEKIYDPNIKQSDVHGKNGVGRLTFFTFASQATWTTVYSRDNINYEYTIAIDVNDLNHYNHNDPVVVEKSTGTSVEFINVSSEEFTISSIKEQLCKEFCWYLELNEDKGYKILINGEKLDYTNLILEKESVEVNEDSIKPPYVAKFICWKLKLAEYSKYYYIDSNGDEKQKENTTYNNKGDSFYHSVFIKSPLFNNFDFKSNSENEQIDINGNIIYTKRSNNFQLLMREINQKLFDKRRPFLKNHVSEVIESLEINSAFPNYDENDPLLSFRKSQVEEVISCLYIAQPKIFSSSMNKEQRKTFIRLIDLIMESGEVNSLFEILEEILDMDSNDRKELSEILNYASLSNITKTIKLLEARFSAIEDLKQLVFNKDLKANEIDHIQKMIESHYWIFGEQYNLVTAAEPNFEEALRRYMYLLNKEYEDKGIEHPDKLKQMDIFAVRQNIHSDTIDNIVVELKHPNIKLGEKQLSQVKKYMSVIRSVDEFNAPNMRWEFYLVGNRFSSDKYIENEINNNKAHGEKSLVFKVDNYRVYVKTWSEVFTEFQVRYNYLLNKLSLKREKMQQSYKSADEVIFKQQNNIAKMPEEIKIGV